MYVVVTMMCTGAFGYFEVTHDITRYCKAKVFERVGKRTPIAVRFSTVGKHYIIDCNVSCCCCYVVCSTQSGGESGSADTVRDPRGFAVKLYTEEGNWDLVGNNTPIFFIRDPLMVSLVNIIYSMK